MNTCVWHLNARIWQFKCWRLALMKWTPDQIEHEKQVALAESFLASKH